MGFLKEVLGDLLAEAEESQQSIAVSIQEGSEFFLNLSSVSQLHSLPFMY